MTFEPVTFFVFGFIATLLVMDVWGRRHHVLPRPPHSHHHEGPELSRHEVAGHAIIVFECKHCRLRFKGEM